jgi:hypothetical protein
LLSGEELLLYTHDLTTAPDRVYQYRMRLAVMNPLYGRTDLNDNQEAADQALLYSPWSQWTEQVQTRGMRYLFVTGGSKSTRTATVQVWKFHNGQWINGTFRVNAGDPVGTTVTSASLIGGGQALLDPTGADLSTELDAVDIGFEEREIFAGTETTSTRLLTVGGGGELAHHIEALDTARMQKIREDLKEAAPQLAMQEEDRRPDEMEEPWEGEGRFDRDRRRDDRFRDDRRRMEMEDLEPDGGRYRGEGE